MMFGLPARLTIISGGVSVVQVGKTSNLIAASLPHSHLLEEDLRDARQVLRLLHRG